MPGRARTITMILLAGGALLLAFAFLRPRPAGAGDEVPRHGRWLRVQVFEPGAVAPNVAVHVPMAAVSALLSAASHSGLLDHHLAMTVNEGRSGDEPDFRLTGADIVALWSAVERSGRAELVRVSGPDGERVVIAID